jgi:hypothetical protein
VNEADWLVCNDPRPMLEFLLESATDRKLRVFACASCRLVWYLFTDERSRRAVEAAERLADGAIGDLVAADAAYGAYREAKTADGYDDNSDVHPEYAGHLPFVAWATTQAADFASEWVLSLPTAWDDGGAFAEAQCGLLRDLFGNPFRPAVVDSVWLTWNSGTVPRLAEAAYQECELPSGHLDMARLALLADTLENAGCDDAEILSHLRSAGPHVRGCWVVDRLTGRS